MKIYVATAAHLEHPGVVFAAAGDTPNAALASLQATLEDHGHDERSKHNFLLQVTRCEVVQEMRRADVSGQAID